MKKNAFWIYGKHAVEAALQNPGRVVQELLGTKNALANLGHVSVPSKVVSPQEIERVVGKDAVHQGVAVRVLPLEEPEIDEVVTNSTRLLVLDQVTDPHNIGAILRSSAAFGVSAVIVPKDNAPAETGVMAKAACGGLEVVPMIRVTNLTKTLEALKNEGFWVIGMDGRAKTRLNQAPRYDKTIFVMGAEGKGVRPLVAKQCDVMVKVPMEPAMESLNVSNATSIALYTLYSNAG